MIESIYKLFRAAEWQAFQNAGEFQGSEHDMRDGFIHFSAAHQVRATFEKYFAADEGVVLAAVATTGLEAALKWEVSRGGDKFPHLYAVLKRDHVRHSVEIRKDAGGRPIFPTEIP